VLFFFFFLLIIIILLKEKGKALVEESIQESRIPYALSMTDSHLSVLPCYMIPLQELVIFFAIKTSLN